VCRDGIIPPKDECPEWQEIYAFPQDTQQFDITQGDQDRAAFVLDVSPTLPCESGDASMCATGFLDELAPDVDDSYGDSLQHDGFKSGAALTINVSPRLPPG
jgi:hypothetical protein